MTQPPVVHATFVIERSYPRTPAQVFAAFADPVKKERWYGGGEGSDPISYELDFREGGQEVSRRRFKEDTPFPGVELAAINTYDDIVPDRRIVFTQTMTIGGRRISVSLTTVELLAAGAGTDMICTNQVAFFEGSDGAKMREDG